MDFIATIQRPEYSDSILFTDRDWPQFGIHGGQQQFFIRAFDMRYNGALLWSVAGSVGTNATLSGPLTVFGDNVVGIFSGVHLQHLHLHV